LCVIGTVLIYTVELMAFNQDIGVTTAATASIATLNNIGPGLAGVGATSNYAQFSQPSLIIMCVLMALGRLEVYAIFVLVHWRFWRGD